MGKVLIVAPHADDEVIGCGGLMAKMSREHEVHLIVFAIGNPVPGPQAEELEASCGVLGIHKWGILFRDKSGFLDTVPMFDLVGELDWHLGRENYNEVYIPADCHMHDHAVVHRACMAALRPGAIKSPPSLIAIYDHTWPRWAYNYDMGRMYVDITTTMGVKLKAMSCYRSQLERHSKDHPVSLQSIVRLALARGFEAGCKYAELYYVKYLRRF